MKTAFYTVAECRIKTKSLAVTLSFSTIDTMHPLGGCVVAEDNLPSDERAEKFRKEWVGDTVQERWDKIWEEFAAKHALTDPRISLSDKGNWFRSATFQEIGGLHAKLRPLVGGKDDFPHHTM